MNRPQTGPMQFENDWSGVFIRGDEAFQFKQALEQLLGHPSKEYTVVHPWTQAQVQGLISLLSSCREPISTPAQVLKSWTECQIPHQ